LNAVLARRGYNPELVQLLPGFGDTGAALCRSPNIAKILFIGSPATGKRVMEAASSCLTPVVLELGGKGTWICNNYLLIAITDVVVVSMPHRHQIHSLFWTMLNWNTPRSLLFVECLSIKARTAWLLSESTFIGMCLVQVAPTRRL
jgi:hypothetical protein